MSVCPNCGAPMHGVCWECFVAYPAFSARNNFPAGVSVNIGISEKSRGGDDTDSQYHGFLGDEDEW